MLHDNHISLKSGNVPHVINIFHVYNSYRFLRFYCEICKMCEKCIGSFENKNDYIVADKADAWLQPLLVGRCDTFSSDDFYVNGSNRFRQEKILKAVMKIQKQFGA